MEELQILLEELLNIDLINIIISGPRRDGAAAKIKIRPVYLKQTLKFQATRYVDTKVFHENYEKEPMEEAIIGWMSGDYARCSFRPEAGMQRSL